MKHIRIEKPTAGSAQVLAVFFCLFVAACGSDVPEEKLVVNNDKKEDIKEEPAEMVYGFPADSFQVERGRIKRNQFLAEILQEHNVDYRVIDKLARRSKAVFDVRDMRANHSYAVLNRPVDSTLVPRYFVYEINPVDYVVYSLQDSCLARKDRKEVETRLRTASGTISSSLYETMMDNDLSPYLALKMSTIYAWSIDFYRVQKGDKFNVLFEERFVDGERVGLGEIHAVEFVHESEMFRAYRFKQDSVVDYFNEKGESLRKAFLISPLKFSRITSRYTRSRYHPVQKRWKAHLGTDYAAPTGTPIMSTADGKVIASRYARFNGHYVKIRHNSTYTTQYLHMTRRAVKNGEFVRQGDVIGYVGSTGLATGPHVCYRFWKHGNQVDHLREKFPPSNPIREPYKAEFEQHADSLGKMLNRSDTLLAVL